MRILSPCNSIGSDARWPWKPNARKIEILWHAGQRISTPRMTWFVYQYGPVLSVPIRTRRFTEQRRLNAHTRLAPLQVGVICVGIVRNSFRLHLLELNRTYQRHLYNNRNSSARTRKLDHTFRRVTSNLRLHQGIQKPQYLQKRAVRPWRDGCWETSQSSL